MSNAGDRNLPSRSTDLQALLRDVARLAREAPRELSERLASLSLTRQADLVLRLPARERLELLLHAPQPMRLVRTLPGGEAYLTVREVGPADALPLLALASADQLLHLMDLESWRGDRFDADRAGGWLALLVEAGESAVTRLFRAADDDLLALLFARWIRVHQIEIDDTPSPHGHGETEAGTEAGFLSPDGYHRFSPSIAAHAAAVRRIAEIFFQDEPSRYGEAVWAAQWELPSEMEEAALRWRWSRLEERGFPDPDSALAVYGPPEGIRAHPDSRGVGAEDVPAPRSALRVLEPGHLLPRVLQAVETSVAERTLFELAAVANKILVADGADTGDPAAHRGAMECAAAYVGIALAARGVADEASAGTCLEEIPALELFREGFARAAALQTRARRFVREGWPSLHPRAMETLDAPIRQMVGALLERRPRFHDAARSGPSAPPRDFRSLEEIEESRVALDIAESLGEVVHSILGWNLAVAFEESQASGAPPRLGRFFLTSLAHHDLGRGLRTGPLAPEEASRFREKVAERSRADAMLDSFLDAIRSAAGLGSRDVPALRAFGRAALADVASAGSRALLVSETA